MAFRPVLPSELIHQEAFQALSRKAEVKLVRGGEGARGAWSCPLCTRPLHKGLGTNTPHPALRLGAPRVGGAGALGTLYGAVGVF